MKALLVIVSALLLTACSIGTPGAAPSTPQVDTSVGGDIPDTQAFVDYRPASAGFAVKVPEGWAKSQDGSATIFTSNYNSLRIEVVNVAQQPSSDTVRASELPTVQRSTANFHGGAVSLVARTAGNAVLLKYQGDSAALAVTGKIAHLDFERYDFWRGGTEVAITLASPVGADNVDPWRMVTDSFRWL